MMSTGSTSAAFLKGARYATIGCDQLPIVKHYQKEQKLKVPFLFLRLPVFSSHTQSNSDLFPPPPQQSLRKLIALFLVEDSLAHFPIGLTDPRESCAMDLLRQSRG